MKNNFLPILLLIGFALGGCFQGHNKISTAVFAPKTLKKPTVEKDFDKEKTASADIETGDENAEKEDAEHNPNDPGYFPQWFAKHKNEQGVVPDGLPQKWFAHDRTLFQNQRPEGDLPIVSVEQLAPNSPQGGRTRAVLIDSRDSNIMFAGCVSGGLWRTDNGGASWRPLNDAAATLSVTAIVQNPLRPNEIYYGTGETRGASQGIGGGGVFKSTDGGLTFNLLPNTEGSSSAAVSMRYCNYMAHSLTDSATVYVGTSSGFWRSTDGGTTWTQLQSGANNGIICHPNGDILTTTQSNGIYRSVAGGAFQKLGTPTDSFPTINSSIARILIANCRAFPNVVYAMFFGSEYSVEGNRGLYKSSDFGSTWRKLTDSANVNARTGTSYQAYCQVLGVHPTDTNRIILGALQVRKSRDGGRTYETAGYGHADNHAFVNIGTSNDMLIGNDGGIYKCNWNTTVAQNLNNGYLTHQYYAGNFGAKARLAVGGTQDNGTWQHRNNLLNSFFGGDGGYAHISQQDSNLAYVSTQSGPVYRSTGFTTGGGSTTVTPTAAVAEGADFINQFEINYADGNQVYYRSAKGLWRTTTKANSWDRMNAPDISNIQAIGVSPQTNPSVYVGGPSCFFRVDSAATFVGPDSLKDLRASVPIAVRSFGWGTISVHPSVFSIIFVGMTTTSTQPRAWRVRNATTAAPTWENITGNLASTLPIYQIQPHPQRADSVLFAATAFGLYVTTDSGKTWQKETRIPNVPIFEMKLRASDRTLFLFTHGRGVWLIQLTNYGDPRTAVFDPTESFKTTVFPNPTSDFLKIEAERPLSIFQIFDLNGREMLSEKPNSTTATVNVSKFANGIYFLKIFDDKGKYTTRGFVKN